MPDSLVLGKMLGLGGIARCAAAICVAQVFGKHWNGLKSIIKFYRSFRSIRKVSTVLSSIFPSQVGCHVQVYFVERDRDTRRLSKLAVYVGKAINEVSTKLQKVWAIPQCSATPSFVVLYARRGKSPSFLLCHVSGLHAGSSNFVGMQSQVVEIIP